VSKKAHEYSLISIDINNFKNINDLYGVTNGDSILNQFAELMIKIKKEAHLRVFRISGNEFVLLNKKPQEGDNYETFIKSLNKKIHENKFYINYNNEKLNINILVTIGVACRSKEPIEHAHIALQQAKQEHIKYKIYKYDSELKENILKNMKMTQIIKDAMKNDKVVVYFQGIFKDDKAYKYETLVRIEHEDRIISPFEFLQIAKKNGDYLNLTKIIIEKSFRTFQNRVEDFSINLSFEDIENKDMVKYLKVKINQYNVSKRLIIEILEDESIKSYSTVREFVKEFKALGVKIALDDFGSGYSNFNRVLELQVDYIKIDGSIIKNMDTNHDSYLIAKTITDFSKKLGIKTIAEYIHSDAVYTKAKEIGVDEFQGFLLAEPKPLD